MKELRLFISGLGHVGRALLGRLSEPDAADFAACGLADSSGAFSAPGGLGREALPGLAEGKRLGGRLADLAPGCGLRREAGTREALEASGAGILVELAPTDPLTGGPALVTALAALELGMDLVFASKGALVAAWDRLEAAASAGGGRILHSATVGGGMPVIDAGRAFSRGNPIQRIEALLNGTSVYVLSMMEGGLSVEHAVAQAQAAGLAEADPSADLDGLDAACKLCILARSVMGLPLALGDVERQSVREASPEAVASALERGERLRAVAVLERTGGGLSASVRLGSVPASSPLARTGSENAVIFHSLNAGDLTVLGKGAGPRETASAVYRDLLVLRDLRQGL